MLQLLENAARTQYYIWQRWGRAGTTGQSTLKGPTTLAAARTEFVAKFKDKTKNVFGAVGTFTHHPGKYALVTGTAAPKPKTIELTTPFTAQLPLNGRQACKCLPLATIYHTRSRPELRWVCSVQLARDVVEERNAHQEHQERDPHLLPEHLGAFG